jgi:heavy metal sensor kinase
MKYFKSIKWKLLVWQTLLLAGVLVTLMSLHYQLHKRDLIAAVDSELQEYLMEVLPSVAPTQRVADAGRRQGAALPLPPRKIQQSAGNPGMEFLDELETSGFYFISKGPQGTQMHGQVPQSLIDNMPDPASGSQKITRDGYRELIHPHRQGLIVIGHSLHDVYAETAILLGRLISVGGAVLLAGFAIGWLIIRRALRPIRTISDTAKTIAGGRHDQRIELSDAPDELASLAQTLNRSFDHLNEAIEIQRRFSADASHELRTPVAVVIAQAEAALKRERTAEEYQNVLHACLRAGQRMKSMANSLLELTRIDDANAALQKTACDLNAIVADAVDSASLLSEKHPIRFQGLEPGKTGLPKLEARMDAERLHQVINNLVANAVQHNPDGCDIDIRLTKEGVIEISDNGIGIPPESLPHIFERFYRVDPSRSREFGGAGLGLSIVKRLIEAHGGQITAASEPGWKTTFTITLPLV